MPLTPPPGADAQLAGFSLVPGTGAAADLDEYINRLADEVARKLQDIWSIPKGGTGASNAGQARINLGIFAELIALTPSDATTIKSRLDFLDLVKVSNASAGINAITLNVTSGRVRAVVDGNDLGAITGNVSKAGDTMTGDLYIPGATPGSNATVVYITPDGRICRGASSEAYKKYIAPIDPAELGNIWPEFHRYKLRAGAGPDVDSGQWVYGHIVEKMLKDPDQARYVNHREVDGAMVPDSYDEVGLLKAQVAQLKGMVDGLLGRVAQLEEAAS